MDKRKFMLSFRIKKENKFPQITAKNGKDEIVVT